MILLYLFCFLFLPFFTASICVRPGQGLSSVDYLDPRLFVKGVTQVWGATIQELKQVGYNDNNMIGKRKRRKRKERKRKEKEKKEERKKKEKEKEKGKRKKEGTIRIAASILCQRYVFYPCLL